MPKSIHLTIPQPCHENWNKMTPDDKGRFCMSCQKSVIDFSNMTDNEIMQVINITHHNICGRFADDQLNRNLQPAYRKTRRNWMYFYQVLLAGLMLGKQAKSQGGAELKPVHPPGVTLAANNSDRIFTGKIALHTNDDKQGKVIDAQTQLPIAGASIIIKDTYKGVATDSEGNYSFKNFAVGRRVKLKISAIGYGTKEITWKAGKDNTIALEPVFQPMDTAVVTVYESSKCKYITAGLVSITSVAITDNYKRKWNEWNSRKAVKIFPNPVPHGQPVNLELSLEHPGTYRMEVYNASGSLLHVQAVQMSAKKQTVHLVSQPDWNAGTYYINISSTFTNKKYAGRFTLL